MCAKDCKLCESGFRIIVIARGSTKDIRNCSQTCDGQQSHTADLGRSEKTIFRLAAHLPRSATETTARERI